MRAIKEDAAVREELLEPLHQIIRCAESLLSDEGALNMLQANFVRAIHRDVGELLEVVVSTPDLSWEKARQVLDFEARGHLASIIGYAEVLLDETEGALSEEQRSVTYTIRAAGKQLLSRISQTAE